MLGDETCFTAFSWEGVNWDVMRAMISFGAGLLSTFCPDERKAGGELGLEGKDRYVLADSVLSILN